MRRKRMAAGGTGRIMRLATAILLVGGMATGPATHQLSERVLGHEHGLPAGPDLHHHCPVCITLSGAAASTATAAPIFFPSRDDAPADAPAAPPALPAVDGDRARAPPIA